jgi:hypothetical protein
MFFKQQGQGRSVAFAASHPLLHQQKPLADGRDRKLFL